MPTRRAKARASAPVTEPGTVASAPISEPISAPVSAAAPARPVRLRVSPSFVQTWTLDGKPFIAKDTEPYIQYWLDERYRGLLAQFGARHGATVDDALAACERLQGQPLSTAQRRALLRAVDDMRRAGVLMDPADDTSRYNARIVADYVLHRPFPPAIATHIAQAGGLTPGKTALDLAGGPGDLALALARHSPQVSLMELSRGFLAAARQRARTQGLALQTLHDSCNRLVFRDEDYDLVTVSQALHWLDDVMVCRGLCRVLRPDGSFFVVHSAIELADDHPLAWLLGHDSVLGAKPRQPFADEVQPLLRRLSLLFQALDAPEVQRIDPTQQWTSTGGGVSRTIAPAGVRLFRQRRPFGPGYARGFLTPAHIAVTGRSEADFWHDLYRRCADATPAQFIGAHHWAVLHFQRGADAAVPALASLPVAEISYDGPAEG